MNGKKNQNCHMQKIPFEISINSILQLLVQTKPFEPDLCKVIHFVFVPYAQENLFLFQTKTLSFFLQTF